MRKYLATLTLILISALVSGPVVAQSITNQNSKDKPASFMNLPSKSNSAARESSKVGNLSTDKPVVPANRSCQTGSA
jgi:hypothetical protein